MLLIGVTLISGCALPYYWQAAAGQLELLGQRVPISEALADPEQREAIRTALRYAADIREFAVSELSLPDNDSYRSYVDLGRSYVVWNVIAADEFSIDARQWCFPIAGCVTYRGYFDEAAANRYAARLSAQGLDTYVTGVSAYSTLGYLSDPILNTMLTSGKFYIARVIFHELAHQRFYISGDTELNEAFASAIEEYGVQRWLSHTGDQQGLKAYQKQQSRRQDFFRLVTDQQARLREIYAAPITLDEMRYAKSAAFAVLVTEYENVRRSWGSSVDYESWFLTPLNNAKIASVTAYSKWLPNLRFYLNQHGLEAFYTEMAHLAELPGPERALRVASYSATISLPEQR